MLVNYIGLVSESRAIKANEVAVVAAAIQKQVSRDLEPMWGVKGSISYFSRRRDVPVGYWSVIVKNSPAQAGYHHWSQNHQPYAIVDASGEWSVAASHEILEMLTDPFGSRLSAGQSLSDSNKRVEYLVEICDPCQSYDDGYSVNGIRVSDFVTPRYFDPVKAAGVQYSYTGNVSGPREVLPDGYLSWRDPITNEWWQLDHYTTANPQLRKLGKPPLGMSLRAFVDKASDSLSKLTTCQAKGQATQKKVWVGQSRASKWNAEIMKV